MVHEKWSMDLVHGLGVSVMSISDQTMLIVTSRLHFRYILQMKMIENFAKLTTEQDQ